MISDFSFGNATAKQITLSFWAYSSLTGTFSGCIANYAGTRSYPFVFNIPTANTWVNIALTIPGDTTGTWVLSGNAGSLCVYFDLGCGSTYRGPAGAWASANYQGVTGAVSIVATNAATFYVTGVKLEIGSVATPYNRQSLAKSMADCQRYYAVTTAHALSVVASASNYISTTAALPVQMRALPTLVAGTVVADTNLASFTADTIYYNSFRCYGLSLAAGTTSFDRIINCLAEL